MQAASKPDEASVQHNQSVTESLCQLDEVNVCNTGESLCENTSSANSEKKRRRRRSKKSKRKETSEVDKDLSDEILEEFTLENVKPLVVRYKVGQVEMTDNGLLEPHKESKSCSQNDGTPERRKHRSRNRKKKTDTSDGNTPSIENSPCTTTPNRKMNGNASHSPKNPQSPHSKRKAYEKYWTSENVSAGLKRGELKQGTIRINKKNYEIAWVTVDGFRRDIVIDGMIARNRALEGDVVALLICPREKWRIMKEEYEEHQTKHAGDDSIVNTLAKGLQDTSLNPSDDKESLPKHTPKKNQKDDIPDEFLQQTAKVVYIIEKKHSRAAGGHLKPFNAKNKLLADGLFTPTDSRLPRLRIQHGDCPTGFFKRPQDFANSLFVARITEWPESSSFDNFLAIGKIMRSLGEAGEIIPETEAIFTEYEIDCGPFPDEALACLPDTPWVIPQEEIAKRRDFRDECVFTIDPLTARDLDDALHCKRLPNGNIEVGVHIADVSYFVRQGTALDEVAQARATSTYMVQTVIPMLPRLLCEQLCSLNPDEDRLTMSVVWTMNDKGEILSDWKGRSVIRSRVKLAYEHAQEMIQAPNKTWNVDELPSISQGTEVSEIASKVVMLHKIAVCLRRNRIENGALRLDQAKLQFNLDKETGMPEGYRVYQQRDSNRMIEEFMLLANMAVAHHIFLAFPKISLLRRHPKPGQRQLDELAKLCTNHGIPFNIQSSKSIQQSLNKFPIGSAKREILVLYTMKPMKNALYFCSGSLEEEQFGHYALSVPFYTHFTSPIRRYADVIVHRLLAASLDIDEKIDEQNYDMDNITQHCNDRKSAAKHAGDLSIELFFAIFVRECGPLEEEGLVSAVMDQSFDVFVPALGVTKRIYCKFCPGLKRYEHCKDKETNKASLKLFWQAERGGPDVEQHLAIFTEVHVILTTENQAAEREEKSKRLRVYGQLVPPPGVVRSSKVTQATIIKDEVKKALFPAEIPVNNQSYEDDGVIVEEEEILKN